MIFKTRSIESTCVKGRENTVQCRRVSVSFSPGILQARAMKGLSFSQNPTRLCSMQVYNKQPCEMYMASTRRHRLASFHVRDKWQCLLSSATRTHARHKRIGVVTWSVCDPFRCVYLRVALSTPASRTFTVGVPAAWAVHVAAWCLFGM